MNAALHVSIISPDHALFAGEATMVEIPGSEGDFAVLPRHAALVSQLRDGVITVHLADRSVQRFAVKNGYADVSDTGCTILSEQISAA